MTSNPTFQWERLGNDFYRTFEGYSLSWEIDVSQCTIAIAPFGGAIALYKDTSRLVEYKGPQSRIQVIEIYSGSGRLLKQLPWETANGSNRIRGLGWTESEHLIVVAESGIVRQYYDFDGNFRQFSLGTMAEKHGVKDCAFYDKGFVALLTNQRFVMIRDYVEPLPKIMADNIKVSEKSINTWTIIPPDPSIGQLLEVLVSVDGDIILIEASDSIERMSFSSDRKALHLAISPSTERVAVFISNGLVSIFSSDFSHMFQDFQINPESTVCGLTWCGNDAIVISLGSNRNNEAILIAPESSATLDLMFNEPVIFWPELDGLRILASHQYDFFAKVPRFVLDIFRLGSVAPAAILRDCVDQLDRKSPKADKNLFLITDNLTNAVNDCVLAAALEFEPYWQKRLLRAASFGKAAIDVYNSDIYVQVAQYLRILNSIRQPDVGMLLSFSQFQHLKPEGLIDRLLIRNMHQLAFKVSELLYLPSEKIFVHWACSKIRLSQSDDDTILHNILSKLGKKKGIAYEQIAQVAFQEGRTKLAISLTDKEPRPEKQIPLLLGVQENDRALRKAVESGNIDLIDYVLANLRRKLTLASFFKLVNEQPLAASCFEQMVATNPNLLKSFYYQDDRHLEIANLLYRTALYNNVNTNEQIELLQESKQAYSVIKTQVPTSKAIEEQIRLLNYQKELEKDYDMPFIGQSITETISSLLRVGQNPRATKIKDLFKISDKKFWWIKIQALVHRRDWDGLYKFATSKKSPIGYEPFYYECIRAGSRRSATQYVSLCTDLPYHKRIEMFIEVDDIRGAIQEASKNKDIEALENLKVNATAILKDEIDQAISSIKK